MKTFLINVVSQIIPVMIGVYLGFALNNFGEEQKLKKQANSYKQMLQNEIQANLSAVQEVLPYHKQLSDDFRTILRSEDIQKSFQAYRFTGIRPGDVNNSAYNTGIQTGIIQQFDLQTIQNLNQLYAKQDRYNNFNETMISTFLSKKFPETQEEIRSTLINMSMNMNDVQTFEQDLARLYEETLNSL